MKECCDILGFLFGRIAGEVGVGGGMAGRWAGFAPTEGRWVGSIEWACHGDTLGGHRFGNYGCKGGAADSGMGI